MPAHLLHGLTREKTVSLTASIVVNLAMIVAFASIADIGVPDVQKHAALVVMSLSGGESKTAPAPPPPAPTPVVRPLPTVARPDEKRPEPRIALLERPEPVAERTDPPRAQPEADNRPSPDQAREAAEQLRRAEEAAKARAAEQARSAAQAAAGERAEPRSGGAQGSGGYTAQVWQHLQRFRRPNTIGAGATQVRFTIEDNGNVSNLGVARSSGSAAFDREALQMVRRAAPFPKPPQGAGRDFVFAIKGS